MICVEKFQDFPQLGRFTLRDEGKTMFHGLVELQFQIVLKICQFFGYGSSIKSVRDYKWLQFDCREDGCYWKDREPSNKFLKS